MEQGPAPEYLAECMWPGITESEFAAADARARSSAEATAVTGGPVRYLGSMLLPRDEVVFFFFRGPSESAVETVMRGAGIRFERVLKTVWLPPTEVQADG